ncbi:MAG: hypothetical protein WDM92_07865 [Caulobacteraceae bacterium]
MDVPISLAVLLTLAVSFSETIRQGPHAYFDAAITLLFLLLIGRYLDHRLRAKARSAARDLMALQAPMAAVVAVDGTEHPTPVPRRGGRRPRGGEARRPGFPSTGRWRRASPISTFRWSPARPCRRRPPSARASPPAP